MIVCTGPLFVKIFYLKISNTIKLFTGRKLLAATIYMSNKFHNITIRLTDTRLFLFMTGLSGYPRLTWENHSCFFSKRKFVIKIWRHVSDLTHERDNSNTRTCDALVNRTSECGVDGRKVNERRSCIHVSMSVWTINFGFTMLQIALV